MAGGRSTRKRSKATNTTAEMKKGKSSGASKKSKLQEKEGKEQRKNNKLDLNINEDTQDSKYVPPFSRSAKRLGEKRRAESTDNRRKSKPRQGREKKSSKFQKSDQPQTMVYSDEAVGSGKGPISPPLQEEVNDDFESEGIRLEVVEEKLPDFETSQSQELIMVGVEECLERVLEMLDYEQGQQGPNKVKDEMKPVTSLALEKTGNSPQGEARANMEIYTQGSGNNGRETLEQATDVELESDVSLIISNAVLDNSTHVFVKLQSLAGEGLEEAPESSLEVEKNKTLAAGDGVENSVAVAEPDSAEKHSESLQVEGNTVECTEGLELVSKHDDNNNNNGRSDSDNFGKIINKNENTGVCSTDVDNNNLNRKSCKDNQTGNNKASRSSSDKDSKINNNENNIMYKSMNEVEQKAFLETDLEIGEELYTGEGFEVEIVSKQTYTTSLDQEVPMLVIREENSTSMLAVNGQCLASAKGTKDMEPCHHALQPSENSVLSQLSRNETQLFKWKSLDMEEKTTCGANQEQRVTAADEKTLSNTDTTFEKVNTSPENHNSTGQPGKIEHDKKPSAVTQQTSNNKTPISDIDMNEKKGTVECLLDVDCEMDCTDSQLVHFDEGSLEARVDEAANEKVQTSMFARSDGVPGSCREAPNIATSRATADETMVMCDMIKGLTRELSALNQYLMGAWKEVEAIKKQRQARLKANKTRRAKQ